METDEKTAIFSILTSLLLVAIKTTLALASGSLAIKADAIHSFSDIISAIIILIGIKISKRSTPAFPYGLYKLENLVALGTSLLIFFAGYEICLEVFRKPQPQVEAIPLAGVGIGLTILITWSFSRYDRYTSLIVVLFIARRAFVILLDSVRVLLDASLDYSTLHRIRKLVLGNPRVVAVNEIWARNAARYKFVELDLTFNLEDMTKGHNLSQELVN